MTWEAATIPDGVSDEEVRAYCLKVARGIEPHEPFAQKLAEQLFAGMKKATEEKVRMRS